jgi:lysyl-tRNA synthetase class 2
MTSTPFTGRCLRIDPDRKLTLRNLAGEITLSVASTEGIQVGDLIEVRDGQARVLTPNRAPGAPTRWLRQILDPRRQHGTRIRAAVEAGIREFFLAQGFLETRTPLMVPSPGMEPHIRPFAVTHHSSAGHAPASSSAHFLPTSPEFAMKRLLVGGLEKIFQICPAFRDEPSSVTHQPEFTMLEWYRAYAGYEQIMEDTERLFESIALKLFGKPELRYQGRTISVVTPWPRLKIRDLFREHAGVDLVAASTREKLAAECVRLGVGAATALSEDTWDDLYFRIWLNIIEPKLPADRAVFVYRYPASQAALSVVDSDPDGTRWARRFEAYAGGLELGNAFEELTDPVEQRARFEKDMKLRVETYGPEFPPSPIDEGFLGALEEGMPPSGGIAVGVDRMVMLYADEPEIQYTLWLPYA